MDMSIIPESKITVQELEKVEQDIASLRSLVFKFNDELKNGKKSTEEMIEASERLIEYYKKLNGTVKDLIEKDKQHSQVHVQLNKMIDILGKNLQDIEQRFQNDMIVIRRNEKELDRKLDLILYKLSLIEERARPKKTMTDKIKEFFK